MQRSLRGNEFLFLVSDHHKNFLVEKEDRVYTSLLQVVNYNHMMPTRYSVDISFDKANINKELMKVTTLTADTLSRVPLTRTCHVPAGVTCHVAAAGSVWLGSRGTQSRTLAVALQPGCCSSRVFHGPTHRACRYGCGNI